MQEILWNGKKALLIQFGDITLEGERRLRDYIEEHRDIERLIFPMNPIFIPKDLRDLAIYEKMVIITEVPERNPPTTDQFPKCFDPDKIKTIFKDYRNMPHGYRDGWNNWNPHKATCLECGSDKLQFLWDGGEVQAVRCFDCKLEEF